MAPPEAPASQAKKSGHRGRWVTVAASSVVIACLAFFLKNHKEVSQNLNVQNMSVHLESVLSNFPESKHIWEMLPAFNSGDQTEDTANRSYAGSLMAGKGYKPKHPVIIIPGFVTTGLELWAGRSCGRKYFRQRMWGTLTMMQLLLRDSSCWFEHMELDPVTGLDPPDIKMRAASGLEAVDYFVPGYWVWGKLVEALADVGYDPNNLVCQAFDWRLSIPNMELRDGYFTRLRVTVETAKAVSGEKVVLVSHSYGENVVRAFYAWVEREAHVGWVEEYLEAHVAIAGVTLGIPKAITAILSGELRDTVQLGQLTGYLMNSVIPRESRGRLWRTWGSLYAMMPVGGTRVWGDSSGAPDDDEKMRNASLTYGAFISALPSAKMGDDVDDGSAGKDNNIMGDEEKEASAAAAAAINAAAARGEGSTEDDPVSPDGRPVAGSGNVTGVPEPTHGSSGSGFPGLDTFRNWFNGSNNNTQAYNASKTRRLTTDDMIDIMKKMAGIHFETTYRLSGPHPEPIPTEQLTKELMKQVGNAAEKDVQASALAFFPDATTHPLPQAPSLKTYCLYGIGLPTERAYHYLEPEPVMVVNGSDSTHGNNAAGNCTDDNRQKCPERFAAGVDPEVIGSFGWRMNPVANDEKAGLDHGVQMGLGDGTVPLISLGAMCRGGWLKKKLNPSGSTIITREFNHSVSSSLLMPSRGGPNAADHVDILGNEGVLLDVLMVATGHGHELKDNILSDIDGIASRIDWEA